MWVLIRAKQKSNLSVPAGHLPSPGEKENIINPEQVEKRQENLEKVLELAAQKREIANDDVQYALRVSDATATRYLEELEQQGKLVQSGFGKGIVYRAK